MTFVDLVTKEPQKTPLGQGTAATEAEAEAPAAEAAAVEEAAEAAVAEAFDADVFRWSPEQSAAVQAPRSVKKPLAVVAAPTINTPRPGAQVQRSKPFWQIRLERAAAAAEAAEAAVAEAAAAVEAAAAEEEPEEEGQEAAEAEAAATASPAPEVIVGAQSTAHQDDGSPIWNALLAAAAADDEGAAATLLRSPICSPTLVMAIDEAARASCRGIVRPRHPSQGAAPEARQSAAEVAAAEAAELPAPRRDARFLLAPPPPPREPGAESASSGASSLRRVLPGALSSGRQRSCS